MNKTAIHVSNQLYRFLISLYPKSYQQEFGQEMQYVFSEQLADSYHTHGDYGIISLWSRIIIDTSKSLITQHIETHKGGSSMKTTNTLQHSVTRVALITAGILLIPFLGMQVSSEWDWGLADFVIIGILIAGTTSLIEFVRHQVKNATHRAILVIGLVLLCLYIWAELAVGIFTNLGS